MNGEFERLIKTIFESPARAAAVSNQTWAPPLEVWETEGELVYAFDLPGIPEEKIVVDLEDSTLTVSGSRERSELEDGRFFRYERPFGEFTRSVALPEGTDDVEARAHYANGALEVHVEKREQSKPRRSRSRRPSRSVRPTSLHRGHCHTRGGHQAVSRLRNPRRYLPR